MSKKTAGDGGGKRFTKERVKTARDRSLSSTRWLQRQLNDPYVRQAKSDGYRSRAAYKLLELDEKFGLLKPGMRVVDLGCAPGGWAQVAVKIVGAKGQVVGCDLLEVEPVPGATLIVQDFTTDDAPDIIKALLAPHPNPPLFFPASGGKKGGIRPLPKGEVTEPASNLKHKTSRGDTSPGGEVDALLGASGEGQQRVARAHLVMSDMASNTTGHTPTDHIRIMNLAELAYEFAIEVLLPGGALICKVLKGGTERELLKRMQQDFTTVKHAKPAASRADSAESYVVAMGFRG